MVKYANTHLQTYVKKADLEQELLMENLMQDNLGEKWKLDDRYVQT